MKSIFSFLFPTLLLISTTANMQAQTTWDQVYTILQTKCYGAGCHQTGSNPSFNVLGSKTSLYNQLVNISPLNPYSSSTLNHLLVKPGYPERSFLLRKVAHSLDSTQRSDLVLNIQEGGDMPASGRPDLTIVEAEIIRQWILAGADSSTAYPTADSLLLEAFYNGGNGSAIIDEPATPAIADGFQLHLGPIFIEPNSEGNFFLKHDLYLPAGVDVTAIEVFTNTETDQFVLRRYTANAASVDEGLIAATPMNVYSGDKQYILNWSEDRRYDLPSGTAFPWAAGTVADYDLTANNTNSTILAAEVFVNVYTQTQGNTVAMNAMEVYIDPATNNDTINGGATYTGGIPFADKTIWLISSNTNVFGTDFTWTATGAADSLVYNGKFDYENNTNISAYNTQNPTVRILPLGAYVSNSFDSLMYEATYLNTTGSPVLFGTGVSDEVLEGYVHYVDGMLPTGIFERNITELNLNVYPNPTTGQATVSLVLDTKATVSIQVYNMLGQTVATLQESTALQTGKHQWQLNNLTENGVYFIHVSIDGATSTTKLIVTE